MKIRTRMVALLIAILTVISMIPFSAAYAAESEPAPIANAATPTPEMLNNLYLDALEYTGYDVKHQKDTETLYLYHYYGWAVPQYCPEVLSGIGYGTGNGGGVATIADSTTKTGRAPDIAKFRSGGLECGSFLSYVYLNYFPNIKGIVIEGLSERLPNGTNSDDTWYSVLKDMTSKGLAEHITSAIIRTPDFDKVGNLDTGRYGEDLDYIDYSKMEIGDIIVFGSSMSNIAHVAIYAGTCYNGVQTTHFIIHVGNSRGPEISEVRYMAGADNGNKASIPIAVYRLPVQTEKYGTIEILKKDGNGKNLAGAVFTATNASTQEKILIGPTNSSGYASTEKDTVPFGTYYIEETTFPEGYMAGPASQGYTSLWRVTLDESTPNTTITINAVNLSKPVLNIVKISTNGGEVGGWKFTVYKDIECTDIVGTYTSSYQYGEITINNLNPGTYYVKETGAPSGVDTSYWTMDTSTKKAILEPGKTTTVTFNNSFWGKLSVKKTTTNGGTVEGWQFTIYGDSDCKAAIQTITSGADGVATSGKLNPGTYYVKETGTPTGLDTSGWTMDTSVKTVTVEAGKTTDASFATFLNEYSGSGDAKIIKTSTNGGTVEGWEFTIYSDSACTTVIGTYVTDKDGTITIENLTPGTYYLKETGAPAGVDISYWTMDSSVKSVTVEAGKTESVSFMNEFFGKLSIRKTSTNGGTVEGWEFTIYSDKACVTAVETITSGADGIATSGKLNPGTYYVKETGAPKGLDTSYWTIDTSVKTVTVEAGKTSDAAYATFVNKYEGKVQIIKTATNDGTVEGWEFTIYSDSACTVVVGTYVTKADGTIIVDKIDPGTYYLKETGAPAGVDISYWTMDSSVKSVTVEAGKTESVSFMNEFFGKLSIRKTSTNGGTVEGWEFTIYSDKACVTAVETITSSSDGIATSGKLNPGTYYVKETGAPKGLDTSYWTIDTSVKTVTVEAGKTSDAAYATFVNKYEGKVQIIKTATNDGTVEGWEFTVYSDEECTSIVGTYMTDANGEITSNNLETGTYYVKETGAPVGVDTSYWTMDSTVKTVTVEAGQTASVSFENKWYGRGHIVKTLENPEAGTLDGWVFEVRDSDGNLVGTYITEADGTITTDNLEPGVYTVTEIFNEYSEWYCLSENPQTITVEAGKTASISFENALNPGEIKVQKTDNNGMILEGAEFLLEWSNDGKTWQPVSYTDSEFVMIGGCTSKGLKDGVLKVGADGIVVFEGLYPTLHYRLTEIVAPNGYQLLTSPVFEGLLGKENNFQAAFRVVNRLLPTLPSTGGIGLILLSFSLSATLTIGIILIRHRYSCHNSK